METARREVRTEELRRNLRPLLNSVKRGAHLTVCRYGEPDAVIVPVEWYEAAAEALADRRRDA